MKTKIVFLLAALSSSITALAADYACIGIRNRERTIDLSFTTAQDLQGRFYVDGEERATFSGANFLVQRDDYDVFEVSDDGYGGATTLAFPKSLFPSKLGTSFKVRIEDRSCSEAGCGDWIQSTMVCQKK